MAEPEENVVKIRYEAEIDRASFEQAEDAAEQSAKKVRAIQARASDDIAKQAAKDEALLKRVRESAIQGRTYHGTPKGFSGSHIPERTGTYVTKDPDYANMYAYGQFGDIDTPTTTAHASIIAEGYNPNVRPSYLTLKKVFDVEAKYEAATIQKIIGRLRASFSKDMTDNVRTYREMELREMEALLKVRPGGAYGHEILNLGRLAPETIKDVLGPLGYSGVLNNPDTEVQVFNPRNIVSAFEVEAAQARQRQRASAAAFTSPAANDAYIRGITGNGGGIPPSTPPPSQPPKPPPSGGGGGDDEEDASFYRRLRRQEEARKEGERIQGQQGRDAQRDLQNRINTENRQRAEAAKFRKAMSQDEANADKEEANRLREAERLRDRGHQNESRRASDRKKWRAETAAADRASAAVIGGQSPVPGSGTPGRGRGRQFDPFLTSLGFALTSTGVPGAQALGGLAIGGGFGGPAGAAGAAVGAGIVAVVATATVAIKALSDAMADQKAELQYAATIRLVGQSFNQANANAEEFHSTLIANREESFKVAGVFARIQQELKTGPGDIKAISTIGTAKGQSPEELAKTLDAIRQGNREVFETETGLKAQIVINEYAKSLGKIPNELTKAQEAQALYNRYLQTANELQDIANKRQASAEGRWERFKSNLSDVSSGFGRAILGSPGGLRGITSGNVNTEDFETLARALGYDLPKKFGPATDAEAGIGAERDRQKELNDRIESAAKFAETRFKTLASSKPGEKADDRLQALIKFRNEFQGLTSDLDQADPRILEVSQHIEQNFSQAMGTAITQVEALAKQIQGSLGEFATLAGQGEANPFTKLFVDSETRAQQASERFRLFGDEVVSQYNRMAKAADEAAQYDLRVQSSMRAVTLEFQASDLSKPFTELTGEMKRSLSVLTSEIGAATKVPELLAQARAIDLFSRFQGPRGNERAFGLYGVSETSGTFAQSQTFERLQRLSKQYRLESGLGGEEGRHIIDLEMIRLFNQLDPRVRAQALQGQNRAEYSETFGGAFRREAAYSEGGIDKALQRAEVGRKAVQEAQAKLAELDKISRQPGANRDRTRAEYLAITGALPREELTPALLKGRIDALKEEATFQKAAEERAKKAYEEGRKFQEQLVGADGQGGALGQIRESIKARNEQMTLRVLDESSRARIDSLGRGFQ